MIKRMLAALLAFLAMSVFAAVDVNKATSAELDGVKGIGPAIAGKITAERAKAPFKDWEDFVARVPGVGDKSAAKLSEGGLTVNGATYKGAPAASTAPAKAPAAKPAAATAGATAAPAVPAKAADAKPDAKADAAKAKADAAKAQADAKAAAKAEKIAAKEKAAKEKADAKAAKAAKPAASAASAAKK